MHHAIDKNSLFRSGLRENSELCIGFSCSPTYGEIQINKRNQRLIIEGGRDSQGRFFLQVLKFLANLSIRDLFTHDWIFYW
jgi:hypothetical protein